MRAIILILLVVARALAAQLVTSADIYKGYNQTGEHMHIPTDVPYLSWYGFDRQVRSACITGNWLFYTKDNYNAVRGTPAYHASGINSCFNFIPPYSENITSMRYYGPYHNVTSDSINVYQYQRFSGAIQYSTVDLVNMDELPTGMSRSLIITGDRDWTVYTFKKMAGISYCLLGCTTNVTVNGTKLCSSFFSKLPVYVQSASVGCKAHTTRLQGVVPTQINEDGFGGFQA